jgi:hemerythrin-like domain-containing protein
MCLRSYALRWRSKYNEASRAQSAKRLSPVRWAVLYKKMMRYFKMMPIGPLMIEHRLIEQVIEIIRVETEKVRKGKRLELLFIDTTIDFIRTYADRTHHGKEEDILFKELKNRQLSTEDLRIMNELENDHILARKIVKELIEAKDRYFTGNVEEEITILEKFDNFVNLYPGHIQKEDKIFFPVVIKYLNKEEQGKMVEEMWVFDRQMIHEKYRLVVKNLKT